MQSRCPSHNARLYRKTMSKGLKSSVWGKKPDCSPASIIRTLSKFMSSWRPTPASSSEWKSFGMALSKTSSRRGGIQAKNSRMRKCPPSSAPSLKASITSIPITSSTETSNPKIYSSQTKNNSPSWKWPISVSAPNWTSTIPKQPPASVELCFTWRHKFSIIYPTLSLWISGHAQSSCTCWPQASTHFTSPKWRLTNTKLK